MSDDESSSLLDTLKSEISDISCILTVPPQHDPHPTVESSANLRDGSGKLLVTDAVKLLKIEISGGGNTSSF